MSECVCVRTCVCVWVWVWVCVLTLRKVSLLDFESKNKNSMHRNSDFIVMNLTNPSLRHMLFFKYKENVFDRMNCDKNKIFLTLLKFNSESMKEMEKAKPHCNLDELPT